MGAPALAFVDHYQNLEVDTKADSQTIHTAYARLAAMYHPNNEKTGDKAKYEDVTGSYQVLSNPEARRAYDAVKLGPQQDTNFRFDANEFFEAFEKDTALRMCLLCLLYNKRRITPRSPAIPMRILDQLLVITEEQLYFVNWYLQKKMYIAADDKSSLYITTEGMDFLAANPPDLAKIKPFIKEAPATAAEAAASAPEPPSKPVFNKAISRALANLGAPRDKTPIAAM